MEEFFVRRPLKYVRVYVYIVKAFFLVKIGIKCLGLLTGCFKVTCSCAQCAHYKRFIRFKICKPVCNERHVHICLPGCTYEGQRYTIGQEFSKDCNECICNTNGQVTCTDRPCGKWTSSCLLCLAHYGQWSAKVSVWEDMTCSALCRVLNRWRENDSELL